MRTAIARRAFPAMSLFVVVVLAVHRADAGLIGIGPFSGGGGCKLYSIDAGTGAATLIAPIIGPTGPFSFIGGAAWNPATGTLYAYTSDASAGKLYTINPSTGAATEVGPLGVSSLEGGLAFSPTGTLYGIRSGAANSLMTIDTATGAATTVGPLGPLAVDMSGIAFTDTGALLGYDMRFAGPGAHHLHSIDPSTGAATFIGSTLIDVDSNLGGLEWSPETGALVLTDGSSLYTVSPGSAAATLVGAHGVSQMSTLVYIPEPRVGALLLFGALPLLARRRA